MDGKIVADRRELARPFGRSTLRLTLLGLMPGCGGIVVDGSDLYVAPDGGGSDCRLHAPCSLTEAQHRLRQTVDASARTVWFRGGRYQLERPLEPESGVTYARYRDEEPVLSGGRRVSGWLLHDAEQGIYRAPVGPDLQTRHLFVNDRRAVRARQVVDASAFVETERGYLSLALPVSAWRRPSDLEVVSLVDWKTFRCGVSHVEGNEMIMREPCWSNAHLTNWPISLPNWVENAYELLDEPGEWYHDRAEGILYYKPREGEELTYSQVIVPVLQALVVGEEVRGMTLEGLTFAHTTWLRPENNEGFVVLQAGFFYDGLPEGWGECVPQCFKRTPGAVILRRSRNVRLNDNRLVHLGGVALDIHDGSKDVLVQGNLFQDISSSGIQVGDIDNPMPPEDDATEDVTIRNNLVTQVAEDELGGVGVFVAHTRGVVVDHNKIVDVPYTGISLGWGWAFYSRSDSGANVVSYNHIVDSMQVMSDGGGIYTLGIQHGSHLHHNFIERQGNQRLVFGFHIDKGSQFIEVDHNVISAAPYWAYVWQSERENNSIHDNYADSDPRRAGNQMYRNYVIENEQWPVQASEIMENAGLETEFAPLEHRLLQ